MSQQLIDRNLDLRRLVDEGYHLEIRGEGWLMVHSVPYVDPSSEVRDDGVLVMALTPGPNNTLRPLNHTAYFIGDTPSKSDGTPLHSIINNSDIQVVGGIQVNHYLSARAKYRDSYHKVTTYVSLISRHAKELLPKATAKVRKKILVVDDPLFHYADTAASLSGIGHLNDKLAQQRVAIIGLGGTGSYILDFIVRSPILEIHLYDGDRFLANNAYRAPGAATLNEVEAQEPKVDFFARRYAALRKIGLIPHNRYIDESSIDCLRDVSFVFLCIDSNSSKKLIVEKLREWEVPFIDVGMGTQVTEDNKITGILRTTLVTPKQNAHTGKRIHYSSPGMDDLYGQNIQIADLNALNAVLAVMKWKKYLGFYADYFHEHSSLFMLGGNRVINEDFGDD